jgi:hypothetical protein
LKCGEDVSPSYASIKSGTGCASCAGNQIRPVDAAAIMLKANLQPQEPYEHGQKNWKCICSKCGEFVYPTYSSVQQGQGGCVFCAKKGFDPKKPSYIYLITNSSLNSYKIGIGNQGLKANDRLLTFKRSGWNTYRKWNFEFGMQAWSIEKKIFIILRKELGLPAHLSKSSIGYGHGHSETVDAELITLLQLEKIIKKVNNCFIDFVF